MPHDRGILCNITKEKVPEPALLFASAAAFNLASGTPVITWCQSLEQFIDSHNQFFNVASVGGYAS